SARTKTIDENRERAVIDGRGARVVQHLDVAARLPQLHHWAALDEEAAELRGFRKVAAAVGSKIHDEPVDTALVFELLNQPRDVARRARVFVVAAAAGGEVLIEARYRNHTDAVRL